YKGEIKLNNQEIKMLERYSYYKKVMLVPQSPYIFSDTIYNNICLYETYDDEDISNAIQLAGLSDFVQEQAGGWDTILEENGKNLSGGQAQRISIARAIIRKCDFLIVDEVTSSLDIKTTCDIMENLLNLDCSVIVITHDILGSYMEKFDKIYCLEAGELKEHGTFCELMQNKAEFYRMQLQANKGNHNTDAIV
ncbi:MAG: ATP-binding cassette domain-containing protein, partial [bacterium]|nr:ATP-binding cassette domain-containing protein [bacterium]